MRAFLAVDVQSKEVVDRLVNLQRQLLETGADAKPVESANLHFTVKFFGEIGDALVEQIARRLADLKVEAFDVEYRGLGVFPSEGRVNVVWVGVDPNGGDKLVSMAWSVERSLAGLVPVEARPFQPHLTVLRVRTGRNKDRLLEAVRAGRDRAFGRDRLTSLKLKSSQLTPEGPIYTDVHVFPFRGA